MVVNLIISYFNPLNAELNPILHLLALVGARHIVPVSRIGVKHYIWPIFCICTYIYIIDYKR